jgi:hypothetical protein
MEEFDVRQCECEVSEEHFLEREERFLVHRRLSVISTRAGSMSINNRIHLSPLFESATERTILSTEQTNRRTDAFLAV